MQYIACSLILVRFLGLANPFFSSQWVVRNPWTITLSLWTIIMYVAKFRVTFNRSMKMSTDRKQSWKQSWNKGPKVVWVKVVSVAPSYFFYRLITTIKKRKKVFHEPVDGLSSVTPSQLHPPDHRCAQALQQVCSQLYPTLPSRKTLLSKRLIGLAINAKTEWKIVLPSFL